jgi:hypothetical protein
MLLAACTTLLSNTKMHGCIADDEVMLDGQQTMDFCEATLLQQVPIQHHHMISREQKTPHSSGHLLRAFQCSMPDLMHSSFCVPVLMITSLAPVVLTSLLFQIIVKCI